MALSRVFWRIVFVIAGAAVIDAGAASAGCTTPTEQRQFERALRDTLVCAARQLRSATGGNCVAATPPACGTTQFAQILELVGGLPEPAAPPGDQARCQVAAYRGANRFVTRRIYERGRGQRRQRRSSVAVKVESRCTVLITDTPQGSLPRFGGRCAGLMNDPEGRLAGGQVERCLRPALEEVISDLLELPRLAPNVVLVVTDDQHPDGPNLMPNLLAIAEQGVTFTNAFTTTVICAPSRAGILTGQHATTHGVIANGFSDGNGGVTNGALALDDTSTLATWFQAAGYRTALLGKYLNGYFGISPTVPAGWDEWRAFVNDPNNFFSYDMNENGVIRSYGTAPGDYSTDVIADAALRFVKDNAERPFFVYFAPFAPHGPSTPAPRHEGSLAAWPLWRPPSWNENVADKPNWFRFFAASLTSLLNNDANFTRQRESLLSVDEAMAAISDRLERLGLTDNTIFVFTADHGLLWGEHRWTGKQVPYEESIRIPLAIRYPLGIPAGETLAQPALNIDIAPTLTSLAGVTATHVMEGRTLTDVIDGAPDWRTDFAVQHFTGGFTVPPWDMVRTDRYKYVRHGNDIDELYDLFADPYELDNRINDPSYTALRDQLSARLDELLAD